VRAKVKLMPVQDTSEIVQARIEGIKAWRIFVVNHMLSEQFLRNRQYSFTPHDMAYLSGVSVENIVVGSSQCAHGRG
jgi:2-keto-3-deoxy-6-phosphogluconate aldolase